MEEEDGEFPARLAAGGPEQLLRPCGLQTTLWKLKLACLATSLSLLCDLGKVCLQIWLWGNKAGDNNYELPSKSPGVLTRKGKLAVLNTQLDT